MFDHEEKKIKDLLKDIISSNKKLQKGITLVKIEEAWRSEMGDLINSYTEKMYIDKGSLTVYVQSSTLRNQLTSNRKQVIEIINKYCDMELVKEINFR